MNKVHKECLGMAFAELLGNPEQGTMAYTRCLSSEIISELCIDEAIAVPGWEVYLVGDQINAAHNFITADRAVDLREKNRENELFKAANSIVLTKMKRETRKFAEIARKRAIRIGKRNTISPGKNLTSMPSVPFHQVRSEVM